MKLILTSASVTFSRRLRPIRWITTCALMLAVVPCARADPTDAGSIWRQRLQREASQAWEKYHNAIKSLQFAVRISSREQDKLTMLKRVEVNHIDDRTIVTVEQELPREQRGLRRTVVNPEYAFELELVRKQASWRLLRIIPGDQIEQLSLALDPKNALTYYRAAYVPFWAAIYDTLTHPNFSIKRVAYVDKAKGQRLRIEFEHTFHASSGDVTKQGWLLLDPGKYWVITEGEVSNDWAVSRARLEYEDTPNGFPLLQRIEKDTWYPQLEKQATAEWAFEYWEKGPVRGEEEFRLSYYGFPEPEELRGHKPTPWWLYILLAGLALVIVSFAIYAWRRHRRAAFA